MQDGFVTCAAASPEIRVADCPYNANSVAAAMREAAKAGARLLVLPELCLTGYTCGDLLLQQTLLDGALCALRQVTEQSRGLPLLTVVGLPLIQHGKLYNCAAVVYEGEILGVVPKTCLPNYGEFYEKRYFAPAPQGNGVVELLGKTVPFGTNLLFTCQNMPEFCFGVEICEDLWVPQPPSSRHAQAGAAIVLNLSASDEVAGKAAFRRELVCSQSARLLCGYLYADAGEGESTGDLVFSGHCMVAENGQLLSQTGPFAGGMAVSEIDLTRLWHERRRMNTFPVKELEGYEQVLFDMKAGKAPLTREFSTHPFIPAGQEERAVRCGEILRMQAAGLKKRVAHTGAKTLVVGISGGLDSCLALLVAVRAMDLLGRDRKDIIAVTMPGLGTTSRTKNNAEQLCEHLGVTLRCVDISGAVKGHFADIGHDPHNQDVVYENAQARERTQVLMDIANGQGGLVVGTGDLSELALGWATYNGDHMSMYGVNASVPKTLIRHIVRYAADTSDSEALRKVLLDILDTPVSPELLPAKDDEIAQKTEDLVGPYELHDFYLYYAIRWGYPPKKLFRVAKRAFSGKYEDAVLLHWLKNFYRRFFAQQFKRSCLPDGPKVGSVSLSPRGDWRMPSDACAKLWLSELEEL